MSATKPESIGSHIKETLTASVYTPTAPAGDADFMRVSVETAAVRFTDDGATDPTATTGTQLAVGTTINIPYTPGRMPRFLGNGAVLQIQWYKDVRSM